MIKLLRDKQLLSASDIIDAGVQVREDIRDRFLISKVLINGKTVYFVKYARNSTSHEALHKEWLVYQYFKSNQSLYSLVPKLIVDSFEHSVMVIEWINGESSLASSLPKKEVVALIARTIGKLHKYTANAENILNFSRKTWVLSNLSKEKEWEQSPQLKKHIENVQKKIIISGMKQANDQWKSDALIHGDLKWEHCIVTGNKEASFLKLIDWELATYGDSAWDIACVISDIVLDQQYMKQTHVKTIPEILQSKNIDILLKSYCQERACSDNFLERVSIFCGARLFQTYLELISAYGWDNKESKANLLLLMSIDIFNNLDIFLSILRQKMIS